MKKLVTKCKQEGMTYTVMLVLSCIFSLLVYSPKLKENYFSNPAITSLNQTEVMGAWHAVL